MSTALEVTKKQLYSDSYSRYETESIAIEDCRFLNFTELLDDADIFKNPTSIRNNGLYGKGKWSVLGYSFEFERQIIDDDSDADLEDMNEKNNVEKHEVKWSYTLFNGFLSDDITVIKATRKQIDSSINETVRFLEKTFSEELINDVSETRELQEILIKQHNQNNIERLDICIITDAIIEQENLPTKITLSNDVECRINYWDLKRWDVLKRSKSKREPIDIDFSSEDYIDFEVNYLKKSTEDSLTYYLAIFPADLIYELYDTHHTRLLENNVRVFLSATRKANKGIRDTIKENPFKFFSFNNGISATAESILVSDEKVSFIKDFQIVNGGQTTATIHYSRKKDKSSLKNVFVAVKITALKKDDKYADIVSKISKAANTQSTIANSDFYANDKMLVDIERLANKYPVVNHLNRNIFYFFERMKGQYNVTKNNQGIESKQKKWEKEIPKSLMFNKIDLARWSNIMHELPYVAATGAEKQFKDFMDNKNFNRIEIKISSLKTLIGCGLIFKRIKKLCGTSSGKMYPSLIKDLNTGEHVPVAMSTAIYTASYLHMITEGKLDYWSFYNYNHGVAESITNSKERFNSELDDIFIDLIKACWKQIATYGGAAAQERTKSELCWNYVKGNLSVSNSLRKKIDKFIISDEEYDLRLSEIDNNEDFNYFKSLNLLLENKGNILVNLCDYTNNNSEYFSEKSTLTNLLKKVQNKDKLLQIKRISNVSNIYEDFVKNGFVFTENNQGSLEFDIDINLLYDRIFKDIESFKIELYNFACSDDEKLDENEKLYDQIMVIIDSYYMQYGLSINDLDFLIIGLRVIDGVNS